MTKLKVMVISWVNDWEDTFMRAKKPQPEESALPLGPSAAATDKQPSDRAVRLAQLKLAIDAGTYKISSDRIADKLIERLRDPSTET